MDVLDYTCDYLQHSRLISAIAFAGSVATFVTGAQKAH